MTKSATCCCQLSRGDSLGMQAELLARVKTGQVKAKGTMMLTELISLLPMSLNAANYCQRKAILPSPFNRVFSSNADIYSFVYCLNSEDEKGEQRRKVTCPWWHSRCQTHEGGSETPCSLVLFSFLWLQRHDRYSTCSVLTLRSKIRRLGRLFEHENWRLNNPDVLSAVFFIF